MKRPKDRFDCTVELGGRLRECRVRAGLTQQMLATAMGRQGKGSHHVAGSLERGEVPNPGVGLLADYLRACRAGFRDILSVLDAYTALPTAVEVETRKTLVEVREHLPARIEKAVQEYDVGVTTRAETRHEPVAALAAGEDGLDFVRRILARAGAHLGPEGILVVEVGHLQAAVEAAFPEVAFTWLATASSEDAVFLLQADQLPAAAPDGATDGNTRSIGGLDRNTTQTV